MGAKKIEKGGKVWEWRNGAFGIEEGWRGALLLFRRRLMALKGRMKRSCRVDDFGGVVSLVIAAISISQ